MAASSDNPGGVPGHASYRNAGVDIEAGNELVRRIGPACKATHRPEMLNPLGGFAAMTAIPPGYEEPILVSGTDGVGTKLKLAIEHDLHDRVGQDLVAMCVNDVLVTGAEPFLFLDYYATGKLDVDVAERVVKGIAYGCELAGCSLAGGETAEMPGFYSPGEYDLAGFSVGVVEKRKIVDGSKIDAGDVLIGLKSSGPHSNGYSLIRKILDNHPEPGADLLDDLLAPTRIYVGAMLKLLRSHLAPSIHGMAHITGGGFYENIPRMFSKPGLKAHIDLHSWPMPDVFSWLAEQGQISDRDLYTTFNCGIGFVVVVAEAQANAAIRLLNEAGEQALEIGRIVESTGDDTHTASELQV